jgi:hypothetical protein
MSLAGILKSSTNTGADEELVTQFVAPINITSNSPAATSESLNLKTISSDHYAQRWEIETGLMPTNDSPEAYLHMVVVKHKTPFYVRMPQPTRLREVEYFTGTPVLQSDAIRGSTEFYIHNGTIISGQFINIGTANKIYLVTNVTQINGTTQLVSVQPPLIAAHLTGSVIKSGKQATMRAKYSPDTPLSLQYEDGVLASIKGVKIKEDL